MSGRSAGVDESPVDEPWDDEPRVVKLGGSLLDFDGLAATLRQWLAESGEDSPTVLLAGGGELADVIRRADERHALGEEASHWLCIRLLGVTARLLAHLLPAAELVDDFGELKRRLGEPAPTLLVFDPGEFLATTEPHLGGCRLPRNWQATTDSIAARLAEVLSARLVLLKSTEPPVRLARNGDRGAVVAELAAQGYVDGHFPAAVQALRSVEIENLRGMGGSRPLREFRANRA